MAYDRRGGSPLRKYSTTDFRLDQKPIQIDARNARVEICEPNQLLVHPVSDEFSVIVTGFDVNRDLFLQARNCPVKNGSVRNSREPQLTSTGNRDA